MKTSRIDGILVMETKKPYKIAVNGSEEDRTVVVCKDVTVGEAEAAAFDLEQFFTSAMFDAQDRFKNNKGQKQIGDDDSESFFEMDAPSPKEVDDQALIWEMFLKANKTIKTSMVLEAFDGILRSNLIQAETGTPILPGAIWNRIHRRDKMRIICSYVAFFANPLESLSDVRQEDPSEGNKDTDSPSS